MRWRASWRARASAGSRGRRRLVLLLLALLPWSLAPLADDGCEPLTELTPRDLMRFQFESDPVRWEQLPREAAYVLGEVRVVRQRVFETESNLLHRIANRYHPLTREHVVRAVLPMQPGDAVDVRLLEEAERILRGKPYFYDARVIPRRRCGSVLDVYVVTRDVWSLEPRLEFDRAGGENSYALGIGDSNLFGAGRSAYLAWERNLDRDGVTFSFGDPNLGGSRWSMDLYAADYDDGSRYAAAIRLPFYALHSRRSFNLAGDDFRRREGLYFLGSRYWAYGVDSRWGDLSVGASSGVRDGTVHRFRVGMGYERHAFDYPSTLLALVQPESAEDRKLAYPYLAYQRVRDDHDKRINLDRVQRTEDVALGGVLAVQLGWSDAAFGADRDRLVGRFSYRDGLWLAGDQLLSYGFFVSGRYDLARSRSEQVEGQLRLSYQYRHADSFGLLVRGAAAFMHNAPLDRQLTLGGDSGMRGYPTRYQVGDRWFQITLEERYYSNVYPLRMFRLGGAVFADLGRAWYADDAPGWVPGPRDQGFFGTLANVGIGLRLESTRTRRDRLLHVDLSTPLRDGPNVRSLELTVSVKQSL